MYCRVPQTRWKDLVVHAMSSDSLIARCKLSGVSSSSLSCVDMDAWQAAQKSYFKKLDAGVVEVDAENLAQGNSGDDGDVTTDDDLAPSRVKPGLPPKILSPSEQAWKDALQKGRDAMTTGFACVSDSTTSIIEAAFRALESGLFTIPDSGGKWNPGQCLGFLLHA